MAQRISNLEYNNQTTEYTKQALAELNRQLGSFKRNSYKDDEDSDEDDNEIYSFSNGAYDSAHHRKKLKKTESNRNARLEELLKKEETKSYRLILDLSNAKTDLETEREKNRNLENTCAEWSSTIRLRLMAYLFIVNFIFGVMWFISPMTEKILFAAPFSASLLQSFDFYNFFRKIKNNLKTK